MAKIKNLKQLKEFWRSYNQYYGIHMKKQYGKEAIQDSFNDFLFDIREEVERLGSSDCGMKRIEVSLKIKVKYGDMDIFRVKDNVKKEMEIPADVVMGTCGKKHLLLKFSKDSFLDLGAIRFFNRNPNYYGFHDCDFKPKEVVLNKSEDLRTKK